MSNNESPAPVARATKPPPYNVEAPGFPPVDGETRPFRNLIAKDGLHMRPEPGVATVYDIVKRGARKFGNSYAAGSRRLVKTHVETKKTTKKGADGNDETVEKKWNYAELGPYEYTTFAEYDTMTTNIGRGMRKLGMQKNDRLHIFAATSMEWLAMAHGAGTQSLPVVTAYDSLGEDGLRHSLCQTNAKAIFLDPSLLPKLIKPLNQAKDIQHVVYSSSGDLTHMDQNIKQLRTEHPHVTVIGFGELQKLGKDNPCEDVPPKPEDLCCIMYTSGSTGAPKGVLIKHSNIVAAISGLNPLVGAYLGQGQSLLAYLPLAHILEFAFENASIYWGGTLGYASPRTLTDATVRNCKGDMREFRPTAMIGAPAVWETVKKGILSKVNASVMTKNVFWTAMSLKSTLLAWGLPGVSLLDGLVFSKIKEATGGKLRLTMYGGGPCAKGTIDFVSMAIAPMLSGYGLTETIGMGGLVSPEIWTSSALGNIPPCVEVKLVDVPDLGYTTSTKADKRPQGEVWIRGGAVAAGYHELPRETAEAFTEDGWFKTGDVGEFDTAGQLKIIDRKKNLVKMSHGEYIALEKLESVYRTCSIVANVCIHAAPEQAKPLAIIVPVEATLVKLGQQHGVDTSGGLQTLTSNPSIIRIALRELQKTGREGGLTGIEIVDGVVLANEEWTPQNGLTTSATKINRKGILDEYRKSVDATYASMHAY